MQAASDDVKMHGQASGLKVLVNLPAVDKHNPLYPILVERNGDMYIRVKRGYVSSSHYRLTSDLKSPHIATRKGWPAFTVSDYKTIGQSEDWGLILISRGHEPIKCLVRDKWINLSMSPPMLAMGLGPIEEDPYENL